MRDVEKDDTGHRADQKDDIEPAMIEVELQIPQHLCQHHSVHRRHIHPHQEHRRKEIHAHDLGQHEHDDVRRLAAGYRVEELRQGDEQPSNRGDDDDPDEPERYLLRPEVDIDGDIEVVHEDVDAATDRVLFAHPIQEDIHGRDEDFPAAIPAEEVAEEIEILSLYRFRERDPLLVGDFIVIIEIELSIELLETHDLIKGRCQQWPTPLMILTSSFNLFSSIGDCILNGFDAFEIKPHSPPI